MRREDGSLVGQFGHNGRNAGQFHWLHQLVSDSQGNQAVFSLDMAATCGHELAEMITDSQLANGSPGWYDDKNHGPSGFIGQLADQQ